MKYIENKKFEYKFVVCYNISTNKIIEKNFNFYGADGWELSNIIRDEAEGQYLVIFKREYYEKD